MAEKEHMNLVIIGHIDNGKSTLMGHILVATGAVSDREAREMEKMAKGENREYAYEAIFDKMKEIIEGIKIS